MAITDEYPEALNPELDLGAGEPTPEQPKKRGRPRSSSSADGAKYGSKKPGLEVEALAKNLQAIHDLAALATGLPILSIEDKEAKSMATAVSNLAAQYDMVLDPRTVAWVNLLGVMASIYGPRFLMIKMAASAANRQSAEQNQPFERVVN